jgi:3-hydroxyanthranilate 3,4-dioxygenase
LTFPSSHLSKHLTVTMPLAPPINFAAWAEENKDKLKPPVNNYLVQKGDFLVMAVGGPNARTDYHVNETEVTLQQASSHLRVH